MFNISGRVKAATFGLIVFTFLGSGLPASAFDHRDRRCEQRIRKAEENLRRAERRHGERSRQARERRRELEVVRSHCRY
jgi:hypothetical protein